MAFITRLLLFLSIIIDLKLTNILCEINTSETTFTRILPTSNLSDFLSELDASKSINLKLNNNEKLIKNENLSSSSLLSTSSLPLNSIISSQTLNPLIDIDNSSEIMNETFSERVIKNELSQNYNKLVRIGDLLNLFDIEQLAKLWDKYDEEISKNCSIDMLKYLQGLKNGKIWAIKMDDASGHYSSGFFYGNNYWMGSLQACQSVVRKNKTNYIIHHKKQVSGLPFSEKGNMHFSPLNYDNPPFNPGFYVVKVLVNESMITPVPRTIHLGLCLPSKCTLEDVEKITSFSQKSIPNREVSILSVRSPTGKKYDLWSDSTFIILIIVCTCVVILLITGTFYDAYLTYRFKRTLKHSHKDLAGSETSSGIGCTTYDLTDTVPHNLKKDELTVDIQLPHNVNNNNSDEHLAGSDIHETKKLSVYSELLLSFSVITNFNAICDRSVGSDTIPSIHGLRAFSMAWVILGHTCIVAFKYSDNMELRKVVEKEFLFQIITNGGFSVDTFFFISGFLVSYIYFRTNAKGKLNKLTKGSEITSGTFHFFGLVAYRFLRLTSPYLFVLGVVEVSMKYLESSSVFDPPTMDHINCPKYWWRNILYINTLFSVDDMCMLWSWYLSNDTQFYIIGAIILIIAVRHFNLAALIMAIFLVTSWLTTAVIAFKNNHMPNIDDPLALFDKIYDKPWTRIGPYLVGMAVGWILFKTNCKIRMNRYTITVGWLSTILCLLALIFGLYNTKLTLLTAAAYSSLSHTAWALSLAWITIACSTGYGGFVNTLLSSTSIYPFSRVTYCAYLVHPVVIRLLALNSDSPLHLGTDSMVILFFGLVITSYIFSFIVSLSFEAPVVTMLRIISPNRKKRLA